MTGNRTAPKPVAEGFSFLEGPRWHGDRLWASDIYRRDVLTVTPDGTVESVLAVPSQPSGLGWLDDGSLVVVSQLDKTIRRSNSPGENTVFADLSELAPSILNDMVVDEAGRGWVGNLGFDLVAGESVRPTQLVRVDPDGTAEAVADELWFPNGMVITPDRQLLVGESFGNRISAFTIGPDGTLGSRRTWAEFGSRPQSTDAAECMGQLAIMPDGMCLDAEGALWVADAIGNRVLRVEQGGEIVQEISTGDLGSFACMLGGLSGTTLYICASLTLDRHEEATRSRAGALLAVEVDVPHAGLP